MSSSMRTDWHWTLSLPLLCRRWWPPWRACRPSRTPGILSPPCVLASTALERRRCRSCAKSGIALRFSPGGTLTTSLSVSPAWCSSWRGIVTMTSTSRRWWRSIFALPTRSTLRSPCQWRLLYLLTLSIEEVTGRLKAVNDREEAPPANLVSANGKLLFTKEQWLTHQKEKKKQEGSSSSKDRR
jgi:hypothetical protein